MLSAPEHDLSVAPAPPGQTIRVAGMADVWRIALGHSGALTARSPHWVRRLLVVSPVATALQLIAPVGRGEVWTCGVGTALTMTPTPSRRTPVPVAVLTTAVHAVVVVVVPVMLAAVTVGLDGTAAAVGPVAAICWLTGLLLPLIATARRARHADTVRLVREGRSGQTGRVHDLARHPADPSGTGSRLLAAVLTAPAHRHDTVVMVAASPKLAALYVAAGMTVQRSRPTGGGAS